MSEFKKHILEWGEKIDFEKLQNINNEEETKNDLILPVISFMGYKIFSSNEVKKERPIKIGSKNLKIDYILTKNGKECIMFECKNSKEDKLDKHRKQLFSYFNCLPEIQFSILTNGINYEFYTNSYGKQNEMDKDPFLIFDIRNINDEDLNLFEKFTRPKFDINKCTSAAEDNKFF